MKKNIIILLIIYSNFLSAQNAVIDYEAWNPSNPPCKMFVSATNVPATLAGVSANISHLNRVGQTGYSSSDKSLQLPCIAVDNGSGTITSKGTSFGLSYSFKSGYSYAIYVTLACNVKANGNPSPVLTLVLKTFLSGGSTGCNGPETLSGTISPNAPNLAVTDDAFAESAALLFQPSSNFSVLELLAIPQQTMTSERIIRIKKIRVVETPPPPTFTINPSLVSINCGTPVSRTFTVTNVYSSPGTLVHTWNLGVNNGWLYNGNPAPATINTGSTPSLSLTSIATATTVSNIGVTVNLNGSNVSTLTSNVSLTTPGATYTVLGSYISCRNIINTYTLQQTPPPGATVTWSIYPNDGSVLLTPNGNSVDVDASNANGNYYYNLTASVVGNCFLATGVAQFNVPASLSSGSILGYYGWYNTVYGGSLVEGDNYLYTGSGANYFEIWNEGNNENPNSAYWEYVSGDRATYTGGGHFIGFDLWWLGGVDSYYNYHYTNNCGSHSIPYHFMTTQSSPPNYRGQQPTKEVYKLTITPNPANAHAYLQIKEITSSKTENAKQFDYTKPVNIRIYDKLGTVVLQQYAVIPKIGLRLNIAMLRQTDIYNVVVDDGKGIRLSTKILKQ